MEAMEVVDISADLLLDEQNRPVPQYVNAGKTGFEFQQGADGASRVLLWDSTGHQPLLTQTNAGYVRAADGAVATMGAQADAAVTNPSMSASEIALLKGLLKQLQGGGSGSLPVSLTGSNATIGNVGITDGGNTQSILGPYTSNNNDSQMLAAFSTMVAVGMPYAYNGSTWDRFYNNTQGTLLASAARTATVSSPQQTNYNARGVFVFVNVTMASGTGGLTPLIRVYDPVSGGYTNLNQGVTAITATGLYVYQIYPGATSTAGLTGTIDSSLPKTWGVTVLAGDTSSYTYSVGYALIN
ncbi:MAG: hypothetical protein K6T78_07950 [Alicyclobacillus sp.]|nr:hypothetical protein [Alicyclobacillus sp.]